MSRPGWTPAFLLACACSTTTRPTDAPHPGPPVESSPEPPTSPGPPPPAPGPDLVPLSPSMVRLSVPVIRVPANGTRLGRDAAASSQVEVDGTEALPDGAILGFVLDDFRIRYVERQSRLTLSDLVVADRELEEGSHQLAVVVRLSDGALARGEDGKVLSATSRFSVGRPTPAARDNPILYLEPQGTYNGPEAAKAARLEFAVLRELDGGRIMARIVGGGGRTVADVAADHAYAIGALESGDYRVTLTALDASGAEQEAVTRTITVNLDAPLPE